MTHTTLTHWYMLEQLAHEAILGNWPYGPERIVSGEMFVDVLFKEFTRFDPRFHLRGIGWDDASQQVSYAGEVGVEAVAAFLGLDRTRASALLRKDFEEPYKARQSIRAKSRQLEQHAGMAVPKDFWEGFPRHVPEMTYIPEQDDDTAED